MLDLELHSEHYVLGSLITKLGGVAVSLLASTDIDNIEMHEMVTKCQRDSSNPTGKVNCCYGPRPLAYGSDLPTCSYSFNAWIKSFFE